MPRVSLRKPQHTHTRESHFFLCRLFFFVSHEKDHQVMCVWAEAKAEKIRTKTNGTERGRESLHFGSIPISSFGREMNFCIFHVYTHKVCGGGGGGSFVVFDGRVTIRTFPPVFFQSFAPTVGSTIKTRYGPETFSWASWRNCVRVCQLKKRRDSNLVANKQSHGPAWLCCLLVK